jgi:hypothetical protein
MLIAQRLADHRTRVLELAAQHGAENVRVFGSAARGDDRPDSDVDLLVRFERGRSLLDHVALEQDLEELLHCEVDVVPEDGMSPYLRERILAEAVPL